MYTTKRKFRDLLDSLTSHTPSTPLSSASSNKAASSTTFNSEIDSTNKRRRTTRPSSSIHTTSPRPGPNVSDQASASNDSRPHTVAGCEGTVQGPNYAPWDRVQFLDRLKTFRQVDKWTPKPASINEVQWAKRGWRCVGNERVRCVRGCGNEVYVKLGRWNDADVDVAAEDEESSNGAEAQLIERYSEMTVSEHDEDCLWRKRGCDESIYRLPLHHPPSAIAALRSRYISIVAMQFELPPTVVFPNSVDVDQLVELLPPDFLKSSTSEGIASNSELGPQEINKDALILAVFGWEAEVGHIKGLVACNACFRRLGLWLFLGQPRPTSPPVTGSLEEEGPSVTSLDVVNEHRDYCPWINAASQNGNAVSRKPVSGCQDKPGWELLVRVLTTAHHFRTKSLIAQANVRPEVASGLETEAEASMHDGNPAVETRLAQEEKDKERWAKLKQLKKVFDVKSNRKRAKPSPSPGKVLGDSAVGVAK